MPSVVSAMSDPLFLVGSWFTLETDKVKIANISEAAGLSYEIDVVEYTETLPGGITVTKKRPGIAKYSEITMKRRLSANKDLWNWAKSIRDGKVDFRSAGSVVLYNLANVEKGRWTFENAWPSKWSASDLDVGTNDAMMEEVTIVVETLTRVS